MKFEDLTVTEPRIEPHGLSGICNVIDKGFQTRARGAKTWGDRLAKRLLTAMRKIAALNIQQFFLWRLPRTLSHNCELILSLSILIHQLQLVLGC